MAETPAAPIPPKPTTRPRDWLDDILTSPKPEPTPAPAAAKPTPAPAPQPVSKAPAKTKKQKQKQRKGSRPSPDTPRSAFDTRPPSPRQSLLDAWAGVPYRLKWLGYHAAAAYLGWSVGLVGYVTYVTTWIAATGFGPQAIFWCCAGAATFLLHHRTRAWWWPVAWLAAIPATSVVAGVLLYGTPNL
jgi:hypothetical protein